MDQAGMGEVVAEQPMHALTWTKEPRSTEWSASVGAFGAYVLDEPGDTRPSYTLTVNVNGHVIDLPHNADNSDDRPWFDSVSEAQLGAERALAKLGVAIDARPSADEASALAQKHNALVGSLAAAFNCRPSEVEATGVRLAQRSRMRGAVEGELLPQFGLMFSHARTLARALLDGDDERAIELARGILGQADGIEERMQAGAVTGLRGWWAGLVAQSAGEMLRGKNEALLSASIDVNTSEGPVSVVVRRGHHAHFATAVEQRNTELARRVDKMATMLNTLVGLVTASLAAGDADLDELNRRIDGVCDEWTTLSAEMKRSPLGES